MMRASEFMGDGAPAWHRLNFLALPRGQGSFLPIFATQSASPSALHDSARATVLLGTLSATAISRMDHPCSRNAFMRARPAASNLDGLPHFLASASTRS